MTSSACRNTYVLHDDAESDSPLIAFEVPWKTTHGVADVVQISAIRLQSHTDLM